MRFRIRVYTNTLISRDHNNSTCDELPSVLGYSGIRYSLFDFLTHLLRGERLLGICRDHVPYSHVIPAAHLRVTKSSEVEAPQPRRSFPPSLNLSSMSNEHIFFNAFPPRRPNYHKLSEAHPFTSEVSKVINNNNVDNNNNNSNSKVMSKSNGANNTNNSTDNNNTSSNNN